MNLASQAQFQQILVVPNVILSRVQGKSVTQLEQGNLLLGLFVHTNTYAMMVNKTQFVVFKELPFYVSEFSAYRVYIFNQDGVNYSIQVPKNNIDLISALEKLLGDIATILYNSIHMFNDDSLEQEDPNKDNSVASFIKFGGNVISGGIKIGAQAASKGIEVASGYLKKTDDQQDVKISDNTKSQIKKVQSGTGEVVQFSTQVVKALVDLQVDLAKAAAKKISENVGSNGNGTTDPKLIYLKQVGKQSLASVVGVLDSMDEAVETVGGTFGEHAEQVIHHRYGEDAAECARISAETAKNGYGVYKNAKSCGTKALAKNQGKEAAKELGKQI